MPRPPRTSPLLLALLIFAAALATAAESPPPPDLRVEQSDGRRPSAAESSTLRGVDGGVLDVAYRLRNVGGSDAFAAVIEAWTALGRVGPPLRLQPGPQAGATISRSLRVPLARGMRELCIEARLQTVEAADPADPRPDDNRLCWRIEVDPPAQGRALWTTAPRSLHAETRSVETRHRVGGVDG